MQKSILFGIVGILIGLCVGFVASNSINRSALSQNVAQETKSNAPFLNPQAQTVTSVKEPSQGAMMPAVTQTLEKAKNEPDNFETQIAAGDMFARIQNFARAVEFYEKASRIKPDHYETIIKTGNAYFDVGQFEQAEKWYLRALEKNPSDINARTDLGITFVERANPDLERAIKEFQTSLQKNPNHEPTLYNLAVAYLKKGDVEKTKETMRKLETVNPQGQLTERLKQLTAVK